MWQKGQSCVFTARADYCECDNGLSSCSLVLVILESYPPLSWESGSILAQGIFSGCDWSRMKPNLSGHLWMINADMGLRPALRKTWVALINWGIINTLAYTSFSGEKHYRKRQMKRQGALWGGKHLFFFLMLVPGIQVTNKRFLDVCVSFLDVPQIVGYSLFKYSVRLRMNYSLNFWRKGWSQKGTKRSVL